MTLYKNKEKWSHKVEIQMKDKEVKFTFSADCGKFGTDEILNEFSVEPNRLLEMLIESENFYCLESSIKGDLHQCEKQCSSCNSVTQKKF